MVECNPTPDEVFGALAAKAKLKNRSTTTDAALQGKISADGQVAYERVMAKEMQKKPLPYSFPGWTEKIIAPFRKENWQTGETAWTHVDPGGPTWIRSSEYFGNRFYDTISKPIREVHAEAIRLEGEALRRGDDAPNGAAMYRKKVVPYLNGISNEMTRITEKYKNNPAVLEQAAQKAFGIRANQLYEAQQYVTWLKEGHMYKGGGGFLTHSLKATNNFFGRQSLSWTIMNAGDAPRIITPYLTKPKVLMIGLRDAFAAEGGLMNPVAALEKSALPKSFAEKIDIFNVSNHIQERIAYFLDRADGGDGLTGVRKNAFMYEAWDPTGLERHAKLNAVGSQAVMGLGRFLLAETNWNIRHYKNLLSLVPGSGKLLGGHQFSPRMAANFIGYSALKASMFGAKAAFPAFIWNAFVPKDSELNKSSGWVNDAATEILHSVGGHGKVDLGETMQPLGLLFGARMSQSMGLGGTAISAAKHTAESIKEGHLTANEATINGAITALSVAGVLGYPNNFGLSNVKDIGYLATNATTLKALKAMQKSNDEHYTQERMWDEILDRSIPGGTLRNK